MSARAPRGHRPADRRRAAGAVVLALLALAVVLLARHPAPFAHHTIVRTRVDDASGLAKIGAEVRIAGTKVGRVSARHRVGDDAVLDLELDGDAPPIHRDARAALRPRLMFEGTAYVDLDPGTPTAPPLGDAVLPRTQTSTYVPLADVLGVLGPRGAAALHGALAGLRDTLGGAAPAAVDRTLRAAPRVAASLARSARAARGPHATELRAAVTGLGRTADAIARRRADLAPLVDAAAATSRAVATDAGAPLDASLARLPVAEARLRDGGRALAGTVARLRPLARDLPPAARALTPALDDARPLLRAAAPTLRRATPVLADLRGGLDAGRAGAPPARRLLAALDPTLRVLDTSLLGALERPTALGTPAYLSFLGLFAGGGGASAPFDASGHFMRFGFRFLTGVGMPLPPCALLDRAAPKLGGALASAGGCTP